MPVNKSKAVKKRIIGSFGAKAAVTGLLAAVLGFGIMMGAPGAEAATRAELGSKEKSEKMRAACEEFGWIPISMRDDFKTIYGDRVTREK